MEYMETSSVWKISTYPRQPKLSPSTFPEHRQAHLLVMTEYRANPLEFPNLFQKVVVLTGETFRSR